MIENSTGQQFSSEEWVRPKSSFKEYVITVNRCIDSFTKENSVITLVEKNEFSLLNYHSLLRSIFHQVYFSSASFGIAGAMASNVSLPVRNYLLHHAEEEMHHWTWILEDLKNTGYRGPDPRSEHPNWAAQAYLAYGVYLSVFNPLGRMAMAHVLEGISGKFGGEYGIKVLQQLRLPKEHAKFFILHGELDQGHSADIAGMFESLNLTPQQWSEMEHVARTTSKMYKNIYNFSAGESLIL